MKAVAVFPGTREVKLINHAEPHISRPTDVKIRILDVGICGTDKEIVTFEYGMPPAGSDYLIIGHESLGEVVETGNAVQSVKPGDLVVTMVRRPCSHAECQPCRSGNSDFCFTGDFSECGIKERHGFMTEFVVEDAAYVHIIPPALRDVAVLIEPLTIATQALLQTRAILHRLPWFEPRMVHGPRDRTYHALVLGAGAVGLLGAMALLTFGFETYVYNRAPAPNPRSEFVESIGAHYVSEQTTNDFAHLVGDVSLVYEATGASQLAFRSMEMLGPNGLFIMTGVPAIKAPSDVHTDLIMRNAVLKNQVILGTVSAGHQAYGAAIRALDTIAERWPTAVRSLISGRYAPEDYRELLLGQPGGIKNVLSFDTSSAR